MVNQKPTSCGQIGCAICLGITAMIFIVSSFYANRSANMFEEIAAEMDPLTDFRELSSLCTITSSELLEFSYDATADDDSMDCSGSWECYFTVPDVEGNFKSEEFQVYLADITSEEDCEASISNEMLQNGSQVECWEPTAYPVPTGYSCGNTDCYKVTDPALDAELYGTIASILKVAFGVSLGMGVVYLICAYSAFKQGKQAANSNRHQNMAAGSTGVAFPTAQGVSMNVVGGSAQVQSPAIQQAQEAPPAYSTPSVAQHTSPAFSSPQANLGMFGCSTCGAVFQADRGAHSVSCPSCGMENRLQ